MAASRRTQRTLVADSLSGASIPDGILRLATTLVKNLPLAVLLAFAVVIVTSVRAQADRRTVWDGVYTAAQAARGGELYKKSCGHCHRDDLAGGGSEVGAPALKGPIFIYRWNDQPISEMFLTIGAT